MQWQTARENQNTTFWRPILRPANRISRAPRTRPGNGCYGFANRPGTDSDRPTRTASVRVGRSPSAPGLFDGRRRRHWHRVRPMTGPGPGPPCPRAGPGCLGTAITVTVTPPGPGQARARPGAKKFFPIDRVLVQYSETRWHWQSRLHCGLDAQAQSQCTVPQ
jgi:hypothetical protein